MLLIRRMAILRIKGLPAPLPKKKSTAAIAITICAISTHAMWRSHPICCDVPAQSRRALLEHFCHMNTLMAFLQPAIRLLIDPSLHQCLFDIVMRYIESGRILSASFGSWQDRILIKVMDGLFVYLHRRPESRIKIVVQ